MRYIKQSIFNETNINNENNARYKLNMRANYDRWEEEKDP